METKKSNTENSNCYRKFGLPSWMVNNIERLNFVTDFEQYACSPPETEGFLSEHIDNSDFQDASGSSCPVGISSDMIDDKHKFSLEFQERKKDLEYSSPTELMPNSKKASSPLVTNLIHEEFNFSSPDTTPCATPEPSPAPRRRMSGQQDTVQTNPGRWFYLGNIKKGDQNVKGQSVNVNSNKENRKKSLDKASESPFKLKDSPVKQKKNGIKLVISNFDINAVSPTSW